jgi:hypothetical protein
MKLIFFDEVKQSPDYPHYHLGAVCVDEAHLSAVEARITALSEEAFGSGELSVATEFHAAEIYHRKKNFKDWADFNKRLHLIGQFAEILSLPEVQRIDIQINSGPLFAGQTPEDIAFMFLCERANSLVKAQKALGMLIGDRESDRHAERFATTLSAYRANGTDFAFGQDIKNLVDSVHFTHSHLSRFLQLADIYVWLLQFRNRNCGSQDIRHRAVFDVLKGEHINLFPSKYKEWPKL